jgi:hypothetical protein
VEQYLRSATSFEGPEYDFIWLDEPVPVALVETLRYRAGKRSGKILHTFTAVNGYDAVCGQVLAGARVTKSLPMNWQWTSDRQGVGYQDQGIQPPELKMGEVQVRNLPPGHMPYMMQPLEPERGVLFAWTQWNAFLPRSEHNPRVPSLFEKAKGKSKSTVRMRLYGWVEKLSGCQFPAFNPNVHVLPHEKIEAMLKAGALTGRKACDPATARSYFLLWAGTDKLGRTFIFDESPRAEEGEWVSDDGNKGDGQLIYAGKGVNWYKGYLRLREREHGLTPNRNFGDPRAFATQAAAADGGRSLLELFAEPPDERFLKSLNAEEGLLYAPMLFEPARVMRSLAAEAASGSLDKINDALSYDADRPITVENEPHLYISERCTNLIRCLLNWDPAQGEKSPYKDPVDVLRYLFGEPFYFLDPELPEICGGRGW